MATRAGVAECSTSDMAVRRSARSIRARPVTGYWGARRVISASIASRCDISAATSSRASSAAFASRSSSARWRSRTASAVRWPKSASKTAASASRRPVLRPRTRSAPDAIDQDRHRPEIQAQQPFHGRRRLRREPGSPEARGPARGGPRSTIGPGRDRCAAARKRPVRRASVARPRRRGRPAPRPGPRRPPGARARRSRLVRPSAAGRSRCLLGAHRVPARSGALHRSGARRPPAIRRSGPARRVRAMVAATSQAKPIIRRRARPWVMMTVPRTPSNGEPPARS